MTGLVGRAGELLVAAELLRRGVDVAFPASDTGIDLFAYRASSPQSMVPVQVKTASGAGYVFERAWFRVPGLVLVQVFHVATLPEFFLFRSLQDVEEALGQQTCRSDSWQLDGKYSSPAPIGKDREARRSASRDQWGRIIDQLPAAISN